MRTVVIPASGLGTRFKSVNDTKILYPVPPEGKPMFVHAVETLGFSFDRLILISLTENEVPAKAGKYLRAINAELIELPAPTRGPADTVLRARGNLLEDPTGELVLCNVDQTMVWPGDWAMQWFVARGAVGGIPTIHRSSNRHSYCVMDQEIDHKITAVREKQRVSTRATVGVYWFREARAFLDAADQMFAAGDMAPNGEYYVGPVYNYLEGLILEYPLCEFWSLGEPPNLKAYLARDYSKTEVD
jgi:bifunctional N-acetylglucosamine-1-phosphate-uridyltransferase/glucosamine-1-phosphate-acetyltransferase GlmU-like protein